MTIALPDDARGVALVDEIRRGIAVFLHHAVARERVGDRAQVQTVFVRVRAAWAPELDAEQDGGGELPRAESVSLRLCVNDVSAGCSRRRLGGTYLVGSADGLLVGVVRHEERPVFWTDGASGAVPHEPEMVCHVLIE